MAVDLLVGILDSPTSVVAGGVTTCNAGSVVVSDAVADVTIRGSWGSAV